MLFTQFYYSKILVFNQSYPHCFRVQGDTGHRTQDTGQTKNPCVLYRRTRFRFGPGPDAGQPIHEPGNQSVSESLILVNLRSNQEEYTVSQLNLGWKTSVCVYVSKGTGETSAGSAVAGFNHARTIAKAFTTSLDTRQND